MRKSLGQRFRIRPSLWAVLIIGMIVVGQFALLEHFVAADRNSAHFIDISGSQRMRSQRVAFLVQRLHDRAATPAEELELRNAIDEMLLVRAELRSKADPDVVTAEDTATLNGRVLTYLDAARAFLKNPSDEAAYRTVLAHRLDLLQRLDAVVRARAARVRDTNDHLIGILAASLVATLLTLVVTWLRIVLPNERTLEQSLGRVIQRSDQRISLLDENPNSVGFFDRAGNIVSGNVASLRLLGRRESLVGSHVSDIVPRRMLPRTLDAFKSALAGVPDTYEGALLDANGNEIDVELTVFPNVVRGATVGVITIAKDIRDVKTMERQMRDHSERIAELYRITATHGRSYEEQLDDALALVAARLGYEWAVLSEVSDNVVAAMSIVGRPSGLSVGKRVPLERALSRHALVADRIWSVEDLRHSEYVDEMRPEASGFISVGGKPVQVDHHAARWGAVAIAPVRTGDRLYGTLTMGSEGARSKPLSADDTDFLRAVSGMLGLVIARRQQERRLDTLAFFDGLTSLPNRTSLMDRLGTIAETSRRHGGEYAVLYLDLDRFKQINDVFGHAAGDEVLRLSARRMQACIRDDDMVARLGGDEFVIVVPTPYGRAGAEELAARILTAIKKPFVIEGVTHLVGVSIGIALSSATDGDASDLLKAADEALYRAKRAGRNQMAFAA